MTEIAGLFEHQAAAKGIEFRHETSGALPEAVRADEKRLRQILINVLGNAVKFTQSGRVVFRLSYAREMARIEIEDTGPGIAPQEIEQIFEPFARGSAEGAHAPAGGTGLGLTIAKMLTDLMGGEMTVTSTVGTGTCFGIRLFLPELRSAMVEAELPRAGRTGYVGPRRRVLVVDNEEVDRGLLASVLQPLGFEVEQAASGDLCLALLRGCEPGRFDAIFMDLAMPGLDGWATVRALRAEGLSAASVAIVSANAFDKGLDNDVGIAPEDFIVKPVRVGELLDWLGDRLGLQWVTAAAAVALPAVALADALVVPPVAELKALEELVNLGYFRGIMKKLDQIEREHPLCVGFVARLRELAREFQLDATARIVRRALTDGVA